MNAILMLEGTVATGELICKLANDFGLFKGRAKKEALDLAKSELERQVSVLQNIIAGNDMTEDDLAPQKGCDELLKEAGLSAVVERNKHLHKK